MPAPRKEQCHERSRLCPFWATAAPAFLRCCLLLPHSGTSCRLADGPSGASPSREPAACAGGGRARRKGGAAVSTLRRGRNRVEWTQVPNAVARDYRLSWRARGLLVELLSYPPGWETTIDGLVVRAKHANPNVEGREAMRTAARELKAAGYIATRRGQNSRGQWWTQLESTDEPLLLLALKPVAEDPPAEGVSAGRAHDGLPDVGSPGATTKTEKKTEKKTVKKTERSVPPSRAPGSAVAGTDGRTEPGAAETAEPDQFLPEARELLAGLSRRDSRLTLGADQITSLAPGVARWLRAGHSRAAIEAVLADGDWSVPATRSVTGTLRWRLQHREPAAAARKPSSGSAPPPFRAAPGGAKGRRAPADIPEVAELRARLQAGRPGQPGRQRRGAGSPPPPGTSTGEHPP